MPNVFLTKTEQNNQGVLSFVSQNYALMNKMSELSLSFPKLNLREKSVGS